MAVASLANRIQVNTNCANNDALYGPYNSIAEAISSIPSALLNGEGARGRTIGVLEDDKVVEYWWQNKVDSIKFISNGSGDEIECERCHEQDKGEYIAWVSYDRYGFPQYYYTKEGSSEVFHYRDSIGDFPIVANSYETIIIYGFVKKVGGSEEGNEIIVDDELSLTSTNPIQNQAVANALESKADNSAVEALQTAVEGINTSIPMVVVNGNEYGDFYIKSNEYSILAGNSSEYITIWKDYVEIEGTVNHYMIRFTYGLEDVSVGFADWELQWAGGNEPEWEKGKTYEVSIIDNIALWAEIG